jgi:hypothetical protein
MPDLPVQRSDATPQQVGDPVLDAQAIVDDPSKKGSPEWLAAMQLLVNDSRGRSDTTRFEELEREMQALRGMSEI